MISAIDYDGTIANTNAEKAKWIKANLDREVLPWQCNRTDCIKLIGEETYERMSDYVYELESTLQAATVPGVTRALQAFSEAGDVYVITARLPRRVDYAREWLSQKGLAGYVKKVMTSQGSSKAEVCRIISATVLVDDDPRHLLDIPQVELIRVLLQNGRTAAPDITSGIVFCRSWEQVLRIVRLPRQPQLRSR